MNTLSASIVAYKNSAHMLERAITSFLDSAPDSELYLIDNSPTDALRQVISSPRVRYIHCKQNIGFGAAHNIALRSVMHHSTYHLVLNPDVYFEPSVLPELLSFMDANPGVGLVMPKVLNPDGTLQRLCKLLPTPWTLFVRNFLRPLADRENYTYELQFTDYHHALDVPFLSGCFMFLRMSVLEQTGLFDERYFLYGEDLDLSRRIHRHARTVYYPHAVIYHDQAKVKGLLFHKIRSLTKYFNKWGWLNDEERQRINSRVLNAELAGYDLENKNFSASPVPRPPDPCIGIDRF
jgi:GT2 family glycosyltransferase